MLSGYLGRMGIPNIILDKEPTITTDPRGIALDDDGIRLVQGLGLYEHIFSDIGSCVPIIRFVSGNNHDLQKKPFLRFDMASTEGNTGHIGVVGHKQPVLEKHLRSAVNRSEICKLKSSCTATSICEDDEWVYTTYIDSTGRKRQIRSQFLAAADGKTGFTRKNYLEPKGVRLEWAEQTKYEETWVALNWKIRLPTQESHPCFPLWKLGYTPQEVYDLFFPVDFRFLCNPSRPAVCGRFGLPEDRLWRFEFVIAPGEDGTEMAQQGKIREVVYPYITHPGDRYGLSNDVQFPEDCIEVLRSRPLRFSARSCNKWALGRVILLGDAAHVFPPFGGQGIASGFRDAVALAWRLAILCTSNRGILHTRLLAGWYEERKQQLDKSLATTVRNRNMVNSKNPLQNFVRDWGLWLVQLVPSWKQRLELGPRADGPIRYNHSTGMPFLPELDGGSSFPQTYCRGLPQRSRVQFTDDVIFANGKNEIFQIVVLLSRLDQLKDAMNDLFVIGQTSDRLSPREATYFIPRTSSSAPLNDEGDDQSDNKIFRAAAVDEFAECDLCLGRPRPRDYNEFLMWQSVAGKRFVILRPDRFVFAACNTGAELKQAISRLAALFPSGLSTEKSL